jgi:hypothetical protein
MVKTYVIQFEDQEKLVCDEVTVRDMIACYSSRQKQVPTHVTVTGMKRKNDDNGRTNNAMLKKPKTTRRKPKKRPAKKEQHDIADEAARESDQDNCSGAYVVCCICYVTVRNTKAWQRVNVIDSSNDDDFFGSENSVRRLNWQKGRQDWSRPSKTKAEIARVTVDTMPEVYSCMRKQGWAILRDCTEVFHPTARFTRERTDDVH